MSELIEKLQDLFQVGEANPIVLRALVPKGSELSTPPHDYVFSAEQHEAVVARWAAALSAAAQLNGAGFNIYTCLNPVSPDFAFGSVRDADIASRNLFLVDIDRRGVAQVPASEPELSNLSAAADEVERFMQDTGRYLEDVKPRLTSYALVTDAIAQNLPMGCERSLPKDYSNGHFGWFADQHTDGLRHIAAGRSGTREFSDGARRHELAG